MPSPLLRPLPRIVLLCAGASCTLATTKPNAPKQARIRQRIRIKGPSFRKATAVICPGFFTCADLNVKRL